MDAATRSLQQQLNGYGYDAGPDDGIWGPRTASALRDFQKTNGIPATGVIDQATRAVLYGGKVVRNDVGLPDRDTPAPVGKGGPASMWPRQKDVVAYFGAPGGRMATAGKCVLPIPFRIAWNTKQTITRFSCHEKVADTFTAMFRDAVKAYGAQRFQQLGLDLFGGCYNFRKMRGGSSYSMHSWGIAIDLDPARNQLKWDHTRAQFALPQYGPFFEIVEDYGLTSLGKERDFDWMHVQAARL